VSEYSVSSDYVTKDDFYNVYVKYCKFHNLPIHSKEEFGKILKRFHNIEKENLRMVKMEKEILYGKESNYQKVGILTSNKIYEC
jgi:hypothetical protein